MGKALSSGLCLATALAGAVGCDPASPGERAPAPQTASAAAAVAPSAAPPKDPPRIRPLDIATGLSTRYVRMSDGTLRAWGSDEAGALGRGTLREDVATPVAIPGIADAERIDVALGKNFAACVRRARGRVDCWGAAGLLPGAPGDLAAPTEIEALRGSKLVSIATHYGCRIGPDDRVSCWGAPPGTAPHPLPPRATAAWLPGVDGAIDVAAEDDHACVLADKGRVLCWGKNDLGQVNGRAGKPRVVPRPTLVKEAPGATEIAVAGGLSCARLRDGAVTCWGAPFARGAATRLGESPAGSHLVRRGGLDVCEVGGDGALRCVGRTAGWEAAPIRGVAAAAFTYLSACAITQGGAVQCWGINDRGQLGDGTLVDRDAPALVSDLAVPRDPPADGFDSVKDEADPETWEGVPKFCKREDAMDVGHPAWPGSFQVASAREHRAQAGTVIRLRDHVLEKEPNDPATGIRGPRRLLEIALFDVTLPLPGPDLAQGFYPVDGKPIAARRAARAATVSLHGPRSGTTDAGRSAWRGSVHLSHVGERWICGYVAVTDEERRVRGFFAARRAPR